MGLHRPVETAQRSDDTIATRFERQARATPDNLAIVTDETSHTYRELDALAANIAAHIVAVSSLRETPYRTLMRRTARRRGDARRCHVRSVRNLSRPNGR